MEQSLFHFNAKKTASNSILAHPSSIYVHEIDELADALLLDMYTRVKKKIVICIIIMDSSFFHNRSENKKMYFKGGIRVNPTH
mmetsp:Transcript_7992/g.19661  ORF Transcript_7992/g.19661 Transcript_7992/m.19661 type:complete len:83 (-) Transcript_7992:1337-1585(-)